MLTHAAAAAAAVAIATRSATVVDAQLSEALRLLRVEQHLVDGLPSGLLLLHCGYVLPELLRDGLAFDQRLMAHLRE